jgi:ubiquinone/menaquinone biosynthesis C-methylase UbiE
MTTVLWIVSVDLAVGALVFVGWRLISRRRALPCPTWLGWLVELNNPVFRTNRADTILQALKLQPGMKVLDFGCGPGRLTIPIAKAVGPQGEVTAADLQPGMLERVHAKAKKEGLSNIRCLQTASGEGKLGSSNFDRTVLVTVLGEIPDRLGGLKEIYSALKPGGVLSVTEIIADPHYQSRESILRLAQETGFRERAFFGNRFAFTLHLEKP